ncbi:hypothetical protein PSTG_06879 [Puccinia striiformis f. sp. tritici PST-78]|uniref:DUF6589 domain-containing protein n=1 Tax=Puccinia striiformis f. sp. tritici PST-78 TaxID=1165861 RepID=A0A0L0VKH7_9BASI|nr:hypothetical protein PSTG_06879 [Puccinia striiformis f. sp. tritici PST-78]
MPHYSKAIPKLIIQLKHVLPESIAQLVMNNLLISPTGRAGHSMATDQHLEQLNYWLKYFFNHSGIGTKIDRLVDVFSINITLLESGAEVVHQSHKNQLTVDSINNFRRMAAKEQMGEGPPKACSPVPIIDSYLTGVRKLQEEFTKNRLARLRPDAPGAMSMQEDDEIAGRDLNQDHNDQLAPHVLSDKGSGDEDGEIQEEEEG